MVLSLLLALLQNASCIETMSPILNGQADKSIRATCPWKASGCPPYKLTWTEITSPDIDQTPRVGLSLVCVLDRPEPPPEPAPCPSIGPVQAIQDLDSVDVIITCAAVPEGCPPLALEFEGDSTLSRARCKKP